MRKYWGKITLSALLIFVAGYGIVSAGRKVKDSIVTSKDITIPLGSFVSFKLDGVKVGSIRQIRIKRSEPKVIAGFDVRVRLTDTAAFTRLQDCRLSVDNAPNIDERTSFICLASDSGYQSFGTVTATLIDSDDNRTLAIPLLLPEAAIADLQRGHSEGMGSSKGDSIAAEVEQRTRILQRAWDDSVEAARLDKRSELYKARADSIRQRQKPPVAPQTPSEAASSSKPKPL
jgi:hypothetical protein